jgi:hypothetical protein
MVGCFLVRVAASLARPPVGRRVDINRPFQGSVHVSDHAFLRALDNMK